MVFPWFSPKKPKASSGFSLIEVCLQLMLLTVVVVPLLMATQQQKMATHENQKDLRQTLMADQLFDNISEHHPDPLDAYTVSSKTSVYCDPQTQAKTATQLLHTCTGTSGSDTNKGPFFTRTVATLSPSNIAHGFEVTINLYHTQASTQPFYSTKRQFNISSYRVNGGTNITPSTMNLFDDRWEKDRAGNIWYPTFSRTDLVPRNDAYYTYTNCNVTHNTIATLRTPFNTYSTVKAPSCQQYGAENMYVFKVTPNTEYSVKLYFTTPNTNLCTLNPAQDLNRSCNLASVNVTTFNADHSSQSNIDGLLLPSIDVLAEGGFTNNPGVVVSLGSFLTPPDAVDLAIEVENSFSPAGSPSYEANIAGVEVIRRPH